MGHPLTATSASSAPTKTHRRSTWPPVGTAVLRACTALLLEHACERQGPESSLLTLKWLCSPCLARAVCGVLLCHPLFSLSCPTPVPAPGSSLTLFQPHCFPVLALSLLPLHKLLCPSPPASCGSPADPGVFSVSHPSLSPSPEKHQGVREAWEITAYRPAEGSSVGRRPRWGVSRTHWCFGSTGCVCWCHRSSGNGALLCKSPRPLARRSAILPFLSNEREQPVPSPVLVS